ncbi:O-Phosphoseryl-Trna(Sec) Selenium Transferase [Manis pentadactyla]|nr:O-Phosphoseryl-Trna(Sec) Selenium Transferase [Manis pentadactyla]
MRPYRRLASLHVAVTCFERRSVQNSKNNGLSLCFWTLQHRPESHPSHHLSPSGKHVPPCGLHHAEEFINKLWGM